MGSDDARSAARRHGPDPKRGISVPAAKFSIRNRLSFAGSRRNRSAGTRTVSVEPADEFALQANARSGSSKRNTNGALVECRAARIGR